MAYLDTEKIDSNEKALASVTSKPDRLTGTTTQNKQVFDNLPDLIIQKYNQALTNIAEKETANNSAHTALGVRITNGIDSAVASANQAEASAIAAEATVEEAETNLNNARKNIWIKYSVANDGTDMHDTPTTADYYIGIAVTTDNVEPVNTTDFEWSLFRGADGKGSATISEFTMLASGWSGTGYDFTDYPSASYNIEIAASDQMTDAQIKAFNKAVIVGSATTNVIKALGTVPTIDIPVIIRKVAK